MAAIVVFDLGASHDEAVNVLTTEGGFKNTLVGFSTLNANEMIEKSDLPNQVLFHSDLDARRAMQEVRVTADRFHISIVNLNNSINVVAMDVKNRGTYNWRGTISRFHPNDNYGEATY